MRPPLCLALLFAACSTPLASPDASTSLDARGSDALAPPDAPAPDAPVALDATVAQGPRLADGCDPLVPSHCGYPFPSNTWTVDDPSTPTHLRVAFHPDNLLRARNGVRTPPSTFASHDGFSPGTAAMAHLPGATVTGLPLNTAIETSLAPDCPTVLIDTSTGARVAHFTELDAHGLDDAKRAFMIRPAARLKDATRYVVAIRHVLDAHGVALPPSPAFRALRDGTPYDSDPSIDARRSHYTDLFATLASAGVARDDLQLAWDFTTASRENNTGGMLAMRDAALANVPADGPPYAITNVRTDPNADIALRIEGTVTVPLYLDVPGPGGRMVRDAHDRPVQHGTTTYPFLVLVPQSAREGAKPIVQFGHGLFGDRFDLEGATYEHFLNQRGYVGLSMDWLGMSSDDPVVIGDELITGNLDNFNTVPDRGQQAFLNLVLAMRMMQGAFAREPMLQLGGHPAIDTAHRYYFGGSQGGIYGATYMAITTDIARGVLAVPGQMYSLLLPRSVLFDDFEAILNTVVRDELDAQLGLALVQMMWDRAEPSGYSPYVTGNPLPGTSAHRVLMIGAVADHEVPNVGTHNLARTMGLALLQPAVRPIYGLTSAPAGAYDGSGFVELDFGLPPVPVTNIPMREGDDPHLRVGDVPAAYDMADAFLRTGNSQVLCEGVCDPG